MTTTTMTAENQLVKFVNESGLDKTKAQVLLDNFSNYFEIAADWERKADALTVTSVNQKAEMKMAREGRLFLKEKRVDVEKTRKRLKEASLREGQTIDSIARILTNLIEPIEESLHEKERFAEIQEIKRLDALRAEREKELEPYSEFISMNRLDLGMMDEEHFRTLLSGAKARKKEKEDADAKAEADRIESIRLDNLEKERQKKLAPYPHPLSVHINLRQMTDAEFDKALSDAIADKEKMDKEQERIKAENERLQAEAEKREKELVKQRAEKDRIAKKLEAERKEREAEIMRAELEREKQRKAKEDADRKAQAAPDKQKLAAYARAILDIPAPDCKSDAAKAILSNVELLLSKTATYITEKTKAL